jgi:hypothetical protein
MGADQDRLKGPWGPLCFRQATSRASSLATEKHQSCKKTCGNSSQHSGHAQSEFGTLLVHFVAILAQCGFDANGGSPTPKLSFPS